jgi:hypothetical protein
MSSTETNTEWWRPYPENMGNLRIPVSTLDDPSWHFDGDELSLVIRGKSPGYHGDEAFIWISIEERRHYCDRGHYLVKIHCGNEALCLGPEDQRPNYYMQLSVAKEETIRWLKWRIREERLEQCGHIRTLKLQTRDWGAEENAKGHTSER